MAIDIERLKEKLANLKNPKKKSFDTNSWKPNKDGSPGTIRLLENPFNDDPLIELWFHYGIGQGPGILCPKKNSGKVCPICDFGNNLWNSGDPQDKELAKTLFAKQRFHAVVVDRADSTLTPKYWGFGQTVYENLLETLVSSRTMHMCDNKAGFDIIVSYEHKPGKKYPNTNYVAASSDSPLAETEEKVKEIINSVKPIEDIFKPLTTSEIKGRLSEWLAAGAEEDAEVEKESKETIREGASATEDKPETTETENAKDIEAEFDKAVAAAENQS